MKEGNVEQRRKYYQIVLENMQKWPKRYKKLIKNWLNDLILSIILVSTHLLVDM